MTPENFYAAYFGIKTLFPHQIQFWDLASKNKFPLSVRAPTGTGKTEMVLAPFLAQFIENTFVVQ